MNLAILLQTVILFSSPPRSQSLLSSLQIKEGFHLVGHVIDRRKAPSVLSCAQLCLKRRHICRSLNYRNNERNMVCELNDKGTDSRGYTSLVPTSGFIFAELINLTVWYQSFHVFEVCSCRFALMPSGNTVPFYISLFCLLQAHYRPSNSKVSFWKCLTIWQKKKTKTKTKYSVALFRA